MRGAWSRQGSYTVEAALVLPLILTVLVAVMGVGFRSAQALGLELQTVRQAYVQEEASEWPKWIRMGQAAVEGFGEE